MKSLPKDSKEKWMCKDCDYIGDKQTLQDHVINSKMTHNMTPTPDSKQEWKTEFSKIMMEWIESQWRIESAHQAGEPYTRMKFEAESSKVEKKLEDFIHQTLSLQKQQIVEKLEGICKDEFNNYTLTGEQIEEKIQDAIKIIDSE